MLNTMGTQTFCMVVLAWYFLTGFYEIKATYQISTCYINSQYITVSDKILISQNYSRSMVACALSCQRAAYVASYNCSAALYNKNTSMCHHTMASISDVMYDVTTRHTVLMYPKADCNASTLPDIDNGVFSIENGHAVLTCNSGYTNSLDNELTSILCDFNGEWTQTDISCIPNDDAKQATGRTFSTAFMPNYDAYPYPTTIRLLIVESGLKASSTRFSKVTIESNFVNFSKIFGSDTFDVHLPIALVNGNDSEVIGNTVTITSLKPVAVFAMSSNKYSTGGTMVMPFESWSTKYLVAATPYDDVESRVMIISYKDSANVTMNYPDGEIFNFNIDSQSTYQIKRAGLSGTVVSSDNPVAVLAGEPSANLPTSGNYSADNIVTQIPPMEALDTTYITGRLEPRETFALLIIAPPSNESIPTNVTITDPLNGTPEYLSMNTSVNGQSVYRVYTSSSFIVVEADAAVMVTQYGVSSSIDNLSTGDASMFVVPGTRKFVNGYKFVVPSNYTSSVMLTFNLQDDPSPLNGTLLNGDIVFSNLTIILTFTGSFGVCYLDVSPGVNTLTHVNSSLEFGAVLYGRKQWNEYAWILGMKHH